MKKSLLALAVLGAFAGAASAQSSVTVYGTLDLAFAKDIGTDDNAIADNTGSRLGFRGVEDLGGGMKALFGIEHRFNPDTGSANANFWNGYSTVGLATPYGTVNLGRQYVAAWIVQNAIDPFVAYTVAAMRSVGVFGATDYKTRALGDNRVADSVRYDVSFAGIAIAASYAETPVGKDDAPMSFGATYTAGPLFVGVGYENQAGANDELATLGATYNFGFAKLAASYSSGKTNADKDVNAFLVGATVPFGALDIKGAYAESEVNGKKVKKAGIGAHYNLSKRTKVFTDYAQVGGNGAKAKGEETGFDFGIQHNF